MLHMPNLQTILLAIPVMLISLTVHEYAHGRVAYACGDATARNMGRLSLNPLKHLDPIGAICMVVLGFGWAKPVPVHSRNLRNPRRDMAIVAIAGPIANLLLSLLGAFLWMLSIELGNRALINGMLVYQSTAFNLLNTLIDFLGYFHIMNITLAVFNLIPIPPLDGSRVLTQFLPPRLYFQLMQYEQYFGIVLMLLVVLGSFTGFLSTVTGFISDGMLNLLSYIPFFSHVYL